MRSAQEAIETYIRAKDENRPFLMERAFTADVRLEITVISGTIVFPPISRGLNAITDVLVRRFAKSYENVHTFCLAQPPRSGTGEFTCDWLVGMSEKDNGRLRVGCGRYDWRFEPEPPHRADQLKIAIQQMESLAPSALDVVMNWVSQLPYPWCTRQAALRAAPPLPGLEGIQQFLEAADSGSRA
jgi:hypothetical protein